MSSQTERNDPCGCGSGKKYKNCCGEPQLEVASVRAKDVKDVELTPGLAEAFTASLDASYLEYFAAAYSLVDYFRDAISKQQEQVTW
jgi:hypothetical protein